MLSAVDDGGPLAKRAALEGVGASFAAGVPVPVMAVVVAAASAAMPSGYDHVAGGPSGDVLSGTAVGDEASVVVEAPDMTGDGGGGPGLVATSEAD